MHTYTEQIVSITCEGAPGSLAHLQWPSRWHPSCQRQRGCCWRLLPGGPRTQLLQPLSACSAAHRVTVKGDLFLALILIGFLLDSM